MQSVMVSATVSRIRLLLVLFAQLQGQGTIQLSCCPLPYAVVPHGTDTAGRSSALSREQLFILHKSNHSNSRHVFRP